MYQTLKSAFAMVAQTQTTRFRLAVLFGVLASVMSVVQPLLFGKIIDALVSGGGIGAATPLLIGFLASAMAFVAIDFANKYLSDVLAHTGLNDAISRFGSAALKMSQDAQVKTHSAWLAKVMATGSDALFNLWLGSLRATIPNLATLLLSIPAALVLDLRLGILFLILLVAFSFVSSRVVRRAVEAQIRIEEVRGQIFARTGDALANLKLIQAYGRTDDEVTNLDRMLEERLRLQMPILKLWAAFTSLPDAAFAVTFALVFAGGAWLVSTGEASVGEVVTFVTLASSMVPRIGGLQVQISDLLWKSVQIREFLDVIEEIGGNRTEISSTPSYERAKGHVRFERVCFTYPGGGAGVQDIDLDVKPGECVAFVGHTGAGKTTIANLLMRFSEPTVGRITIDGVDIAHVSADFLRSQIGMVFQDPYLLNRTVGDNLRIGAPKATDEDLMTAVRRAHADSFISRMPDGLATMVGERGATLSGGEKQRISIARAILRDAPILVLDEATSALDAKTEKLIQESLDELTKGRTTFVIAHRLSTVRKADRIVVLERGRILEQGSFEDLIARGGAFSALVEAQALATEKATVQTT
jgi:glucan exporter ATP-binding protein